MSGRVMRSLVALAGAALIVAGYFLLSGKPVKAPAPTTPWSTSVPELARVVPAFKTADLATWTIMVAQDRSGGLVPGPSSFATTGFVHVDQGVIDSLTVSGTTPDDGAVLRAWEIQLAGLVGSVPQCSWERVNDDSKVLEGTTYFSGELLVCRSAGIVFFRLIKD